MDGTYRTEGEESHADWPTFPHLSKEVSEPFQGLHGGTFVCTYGNSSE